MMRVEKSNEFLAEIGLLADEAASYGINLSSCELGLFQVYLQELWEWNKRFNLTGLKTRERMVIELFLDSLIPAPFLPEKATMLDVGSGAGFPGLPLKIRHPGLLTHLLETNTKKVSFLKQVIRSLELQGAEVIQGRIEAHKEWLRGEGYGVITARAVADLNQILLWCAPLLSEGGFLVAFLGGGGEKDVEKNKEVMDTRGLRVEKKVSYVLPGKKTERHTLILKREGLG
jgi:16S rRNA (guanine527-N7)-methyltransferase